MKAVINTHLVDWDSELPEALEPKTEVQITVEPKKIEVELTGDTALGATYTRGVVLEMQADDGFRILTYAFDADEPRVFCLGVDGSITEKT